MVLMEEFEYEELKKATEDFSPSRIVGKGSHGCIYKGVFEGGRVVAIKTWSAGLENLLDNSKLENEASILSSLPKSPNVVNIIGTSRHNVAKDNDQPEKVALKSDLLVMDFMPNGSLHDLLHANTASPMLLSWSNRLQIALQIAKGLQFLHSMNPKIVHRDVKSANVLFDKNWHAKLGDFGLAVTLSTNTNKVDHKSSQADSSFTRPAGTIGYLDPCYTAPCLLSTKIDVFSFGIVLLEIISGQKVIDCSRHSTLIIDWSMSFIKQRKFDQIYDGRTPMPVFMERKVRRLVEIAVLCLSPVPDSRPSMDDVVYEMENFHHLQPEKFPVWIKILRRIIVLRRDRKVTPKKRVRQGNVLHNNAKVSLGTLLLRDVMSDLSY